MPPTVIGLDLSITSTGVASSRGWTERIERPRTLEKTSDLTQIRWMRDHVLEKIGEPDLVVVEARLLRSVTGHASKRSGLWFMTMDVIDRREIPWVEVNVSTRPVYATGNGRAGKDEVMRHITRRFPWFEGKNDEADALTLAALGADWLGHPMVKMPEQHRRALAAVNWPEVAA